MKNIFSKPLTFEEQSNISKVVLGLDFILFICAFVMRLFGVYADFNSGAAFVLAMYCIGALSFDSMKKRDLRTVYLATSIIVDAMYVLFLFFLLGRTFMQNL
ncbi:MAG: hypothetical protein K2N71_10135 [Oscillospiraceae bacterium]|nr:hypothetical protein [Oscillospiraceae bacterium]